MAFCTLARILYSSLSRLSELFVRVSTASFDGTKMGRETKRSSGTGSHLAREDRAVPASRTGVDWIPAGTQARKYRILTKAPTGPKFSIYQKVRLQTPTFALKFADKLNRNIALSNEYLYMWTSKTCRTSENLKYQNMDKWWAQKNSGTRPENQSKHAT